MQLVLHTGAHFTEEDRLLKCLLRNKGAFSEVGVSVPGPGKYRRLIRDTLNAMKDFQAAQSAREVLLDAILDEERCDRLILSNAHLFGPPRAACRDGQFYSKAVDKLRRFSSIFAEDQIELFMALRNPAFLLPAIYNSIPPKDQTEMLQTVQPRRLHWSGLIEQIRAEVPQIQITLWCNEDAPLIWAQIIRDMAGLEPQAKITGGFDLLSSIMSKDGMQRFRSYLKSHPIMNEMQKRRVMAAFLDKFALDDRIEEELDLPGLTEDLVDELTDLYDDDIAAIQRIPGVTLISP